MSNPEISPNCSGDCPLGVFNGDAAPCIFGTRSGMPIDFSKVKAGGGFSISSHCAKASSIIPRIKSTIDCTINSFAAFSKAFLSSAIMSLVGTTGNWIVGGFGIFSLM